MKTTQVKKIDAGIKTFIVRVVAEILSDPDFGAVLSARAKNKLRQASSYRGKNISFSEIKRKHA